MQRGQYAQAVRLLEKMAALTASEAVGFANWARAEIPRVKAIPKKMRDGVPTIIETAKSLIKKHDYGQAAELLIVYAEDSSTASKTISNAYCKSNPAIDLPGTSGSRSKLTAKSPTKSATTNSTTKANCCPMMRGLATL